MRNKFTILAILAVFALSISISAQTTTFTYQGRLNDSAMAANGTYDLNFALFDAQAGGAQIGTTQTRPAVSVSNGIFTVELDFGANAFPGANRFLEIAVKRSTDAGFTTLTPRQQITSSPYSIRSLSAAAADNAAQLGGTNASEFVQTTDSRLSDSRTPTAGSNNYIQNTATQQAGARFNIGGTGTANIINATTQYNIGSNRVLSNAGSSNLFAGVGAGTANTTGFQNSFFGSLAGRNNTTGSSNSFYGGSAGNSNTTGNANSFFGLGAGQNNTTGFDNSFFGAFAGASNTTGYNNSFFGSAAGRNNTTGYSNLFVGLEAGFNNTTGILNSFFGNAAGRNNTTGNSNLFVGTNAGFSNTTGFSNSLVGRDAGRNNTTGGDNSFFGRSTGAFNTTGGSNSFFGTRSGLSNTTGGNNTVVGNRADVGSGNLSYATAIGADSIVSTNNTIALGRPDGSDKVRVYGLGGAGALPLCRNASLEISFCSSSLRYKSNIASFGSGLSLINRLRPISYNWKDGGTSDVGFGAEDVAEISPLLVTYNDKGEVEGVKYDRMSVLFVNAFKEQQTQIEAQNEQIKLLKTQNQTQQKRIDELQKLVCAGNPTAEICKEKKQDEK